MTDEQALHVFGRSVGLCHCKKNYGIQKMMIDLKYDKGEKQ
jgi:hypothetical protein